MIWKSRARRKICQSSASSPSANSSQKPPSPRRASPHNRASALLSSWCPKHSTLLTRPTKRSQIILGVRQRRGGQYLELSDQSEDKMKPPVAVLAILVVLVYPSSGFSQQQQTGSLTSPAATTTNTSSRQTQPFSPFLAPPSATIRVTGAPTIQPSPGLRQECTPVEQEIAGLIVGPTDLCDR